MARLESAIASSGNFVVKFAGRHDGVRKTRKRDRVPDAERPVSNWRRAFLHQPVVYAPILSRAASSLGRFSLDVAVRNLRPKLMDA